MYLTKDLTSQVSSVSIQIRSHLNRFSFLLLVLQQVIYQHKLLQNMNNISVLRFTYIILLSAALIPMQSEEFTASGGAHIPGRKRKFSVNSLWTILTPRSPKSRGITV